jgi:hypothetical protein
MAVTSQSNLQQGTIVADAIISEVQLATPMLARLIGTARPGRNGSGPVWDVRGGRVTTAAHADGSTFGTPTVDTVSQPALGWGNYETPFEVTDEALGSAMMGNPDQYRGDAMGYLFQNALKNHLKKLEAELFSGTGSNHIIGFDTALDDSNTYAGISRSAVPNFGSYIKDPGSPTTVTKGLLEDFVSEAADNCGDYMAFMVARNRLFNKINQAYQGVLTANQNSNVPFTNAGLGRSDSISILGVPTSAVFDGYVSNNVSPGSSDYGHLYAFGSNAVHLEIRKYPGAEKVVLDNLPLGIQVLNDPSGAHSTRWVIRNSFALVVDDPFRCAKFVNLKIV